MEDQYDNERQTLLQLDSALRIGSTT
jgi:hypothetical protein